jgi:dTDP-4-amino-4,6-dideoxygalactose transaminase
LIGDIPAILGGKPAFPKRVPITSPTLPLFEQISSELKMVLESSQLTNGPRVQELEKAILKHIGGRYAVAMSSCTSGLILSLRALRVRGEAVLPSFTFSATGHALLWNNLEPAFADIDPETLQIDPEQAESLINRKTGAIVAVHTYGSPCDVAALQDIATDHKIPLIFDAAHALGASVNGRFVGTFGSGEVFSLSPTKLVVAGEGGVVTTSNEEFAHLLRAGRNYGDSGDYDPLFPGLSARMGEWNAVLAKHSLDFLDVSMKARAALVELYLRRLSCHPGIRFQKIAQGTVSTWKDFSIFLDQEEAPLSREELCYALERENIVCRRYFSPPLHLSKIWSGNRSKRELPHTEKASREVLSLPIYSHMPLEVAARICDVIDVLFNRSSEVKIALKMGFGP